MNKKNTIELVTISGLVAASMLTVGCATVYRDPIPDNESVSLLDEPAANDRVYPSSFEVEPSAMVVYPDKRDEKPLPYWKMREQGLVDRDSEVASSEVPPAGLSGAYTRYTVKKNDSISAVAYRYGLRWQDVAAVNPGLDPNKVRVGQVINLPGKVDLSKPVRSSAPSGVYTGKTSASENNVYVVKSGDYIGKIAKQFKITRASLMAANNLKNDRIYAGQKLVIPGKTATSASASPVRTDIKKPPKQSVVAQPDTTRHTPVTPPLTSSVIPESSESETPVMPLLESPVIPALQETPAVPSDAVVPVVAKHATHTVVEGEDLYVIAVRWGVSTEALLKANNLASDNVAPGTVLKIPVVSAQ